MTDQPQPEGEGERSIPDPRPMLVLCRRCLNPGSVTRKSCSKCGWDTEAVEWESEVRARAEASDQALAQAVEALERLLDAGEGFRRGLSFDAVEYDDYHAEPEQVEDFEAALDKARSALTQLQPEEEK